MGVFLTERSGKHPSVGGTGSDGVGRLVGEQAVDLATGVVDDVDDLGELVRVADADDLSGRLAECSDGAEQVTGVDPTVWASCPRLVAGISDAALRLLARPPR